MTDVAEELTLELGCPGTFVPLLLLDQLYENFIVNEDPQLLVVFTVLSLEQEGWAGAELSDQALLMVNYVLEDLQSKYRIQELVCKEDGDGVSLVIDSVTQAKITVNRQALYQMYENPLLEV